jgi:Collagen triple helix repeat (20 copies)
MKLLRRTPLTLAAAILAGATMITVPALALTGGKAARFRHCRAVIVISHHHRIRACLLRGPRGFRGPPGPSGSSGPRGLRGLTGARGTMGQRGFTGSQGPAGTARAFAVVQPTSATVATLIAGQTSNITSVSEPKEGVFCLTPAAGIFPSTTTATVSPEVAYSSAGAPIGIAAVNAKRPDCPTGQFEVETFKPDGTTRTSEYAFSILVA